MMVRMFMDFKARLVRHIAGQANVEHDVMNGSDTPMAFVEIETKRIVAIRQV
jgi:hypothetical protein